MKVELTEEERIFFDILIDQHEKSVQALDEYGIFEDEIRVIKMRSEYQNLDIDVEKILESLQDKNIIREIEIRKKSGGVGDLKNCERDKKLHQTAKSVKKRYELLNKEILEYIDRELEEK